MQLLIDRIFTFTIILLGPMLFFGCATATQEQPPAPQPVTAPTSAPVKPEPIVATPKPTPTPTPVALKQTTTYTVRRGDHLWGIAAKPSIYGDPYYWPLLYKANFQIIRDADLIHPGQSLQVDLQPSAAEVRRAVDHAKMRGPWKLGVVEESDKRYLGR